MAEKKTDSAPTAAASAGGEKKMKKAEALRQAVEAIGIDATPTELQKYIKDTFHIDMGRDHISTAKGELRRKLKVKGRPGRKPGSGKKAAAAPAATHAPAKDKTSASATNGTNALQVDEMLMLMSLVRRVSPRVVHELIDGMGR